MKFSQFLDERHITLINSSQNPIKSLPYLDNLNHTSSTFNPHSYNTKGCLTPLNLVILDGISE